MPPALTGSDFYSEIGINVTPELEHWPSNYQPDSYRLRGYDGRDNGEHFCEGAHGRTLSSSGTECPPGQRNKAKKRSYSTEAD
ncbi:hypothetical protein V5738_16210 [Salinisphaera sp. SPP-AMP-43]|uniref:hypothetical protein n=1 Tax=Salinisphaera sp. SPP-AMP-43 TaxID=3121288 RepID=UPI003C6E2980